MAKKNIKWIILIGMLINSNYGMLGSNKNLIFSQSEPDYFTIIMDRIAAYQFDSNTVPNEKYITTILSSITENGSYTDIDYSSNEAIIWKPLSHLDRAKNLVLAYTSKKSKLYGDDNLYQTIVKTLDFWKKVHPSSISWYKQEIATPQRIGILLILMRYGKKQLPEALEKDLINRVKDEGGDPQKQNGANKVDIATHWIYRGCLTCNNDILSYGVAQAFSTLSMTVKEGFQYDYSFHQHGRQLYIGGYGTVLIEGIINLANFAIDTPYELNIQQIKLLANFIINGYLPSIRGKYFLYTALGRGISRPNALLYSGFSGLLEKLIKLDPTNEKQYKSAIKRLRGEEAPNYGLSPLNIYYWCSDYTVHQRPSYTIGVRMASTYVSRVENGDGENLKGYFLSDGAMCIVTEGNEYNQIFPVWDWKRIPGVTAPFVRDIPLPKAWGYRGKSPFAGGVSDGLYGVVTYQYTDHDFNLNVDAKKSYFFFDDEILCLGAGITSTSSYPVNTTINQTLLNGKVILHNENNEYDLEKGTDMSGKLSWIIHDNIGYYFPEKTLVSVSSKKQTGSWKSIRNISSDEAITKDVLKLWIDHGVTPQNDRYSYIILPNKYSLDKIREYPVENIKIIENNEKKQVVKHNKYNMLGLVFYEAGEFSYEDIKVEVNKGCVLLFEEINSSNVKMFIADPSKKEKEISVTVSFPSIKGVKKIDCYFSIFPNYQAGKTQKYLIKNNIIQNIV